MNSNVIAVSMVTLISNVALALPTKQVCKSTTKEIAVCIEEPNMYGRVMLTVRGVKSFLNESTQVGTYKDEHYAFDGDSIERIESGEVLGLLCHQATPGFCR